MKITGSLLGSCRHQSIFSHYFPPRLYSLKEVEYFLYRLQIFKSFFDNHMYEDEIFKDCIDIMIGDACHKIVIEESKNFFAHTDSFFSNTNFFIEVSTLTYCRKGNSIVSPFILDLRRDLFNDKHHLNDMGVQIASDTILLLTGSQHFPKQRYLNKIKQNLFGLN